MEQVVADNDFTPGELEGMLAVGEAQVREGRFVGGEEVFRRIQCRSDARRKGA